jgi:trehalose 6-phosphate phosphatase
MRDAAEIRRDWALFLDLDGTLLDIAAKPDEVKVPSMLALELSRVRHDLDGAVAIVSGRELAVLDDLLSPFSGAGAGEHGAVVRLPDGSLDKVRTPVIPRLWIEKLRAAAESWPGIVVERKPRSVCVHYRLAPEREQDALALVSSLPDLEAEGFTILRSKMAFEVKPRSSSKGRAVALLMETPPFVGRTPVYVGDDVTDEDGIAMAAKLGGFGLRVEQAFEGQPQKVRDWLARGVAA